MSTNRVNQSATYTVVHSVYARNDESKYLMSSGNQTKIVLFEKLSYNITAERK